MIKSIRVRVQLWYAGVLVGVVVSFATLTYARVHSMKLGEVDTQLEVAVRSLDAILRSFPLKEFEPDAPPSPTEKAQKERKSLPPEERDKRLAELILPKEVESRMIGTSGEEPYFVIWRSDAETLKTHRVPGEERRPMPNHFTPAGVLTFTNAGWYREASMKGTGGTRILVGRSVARDYTDLGRFAGLLIVVGLLVFIIGLAGGWVVASRMMQPLAAMSATAASISARKLSERIETQKLDTELVDLAEVLNAMFERLQTAFVRQQQFTADASHELRTPIAILRSHAELALSRPRTVEEYRQTLETCLRSANRMTTLVQGLLLLARNDAGHSDETFRKVALAPLIEECVALFRPIADAKEVRLTLDLTPCYVRGNADSLIQVVSNLLSNALHHTPPNGAVFVSLSVRDNDVRIAVRDTGTGIPPEFQAHIFERFYRVDKSRARASGGFGLGLAICKSIVDSHKGQIGFDSEPGHGTTFWIHLPLKMK